MASMLASSSFVGSSKALSQRVRASGASRQQVKVQAAVLTKGKTATANYVCLDCGYLYTGAVPFEEAPKSYSCPVCGAPKRRFKQLRGTTGRNNDAKSMLARKEKLREQLVEDGQNPDEGGNELLIATGAGTLAFLGAVYYFFTQS